MESARRFPEVVVAAVVLLLGFSEGVIVYPANAAGACDGAIAYAAMQGKVYTKAGGDFGFQMPVAFYSGARATISGYTPVVCDNGVKGSSSAWVGVGNGKSDQNPSEPTQAVQTGYLRGGTITGGKVYYYYEVWFGNEDANHRVNYQAGLCDLSAPQPYEVSGSKDGYWTVKYGGNSKTFPLVGPCCFPLPEWSAEKHNTIDHFVGSQGKPVSFTKCASLHNNVWSAPGTDWKPFTTTNGHAHVSAPLVDSFSVWDGRDP